MRLTLKLKILSDHVRPLLNWFGLTCCWTNPPNNYTHHVTHTHTATHVHVRTYLWYEENEEAGEAGPQDGEDGDHVGGVHVYGAVEGEDEGEGRAYAHQDHHYVHGDAHVAGVVDEDVLDVPALVGQEQPKHHQQALVHVGRPHKVVEVLAVAVLVDLLDVVATVLGLLWV